MIDRLPQLSKKDLKKISLNDDVALYRDSHAAFQFTGVIFDQISVWQNVLQRDTVSINKIINSQNTSFTTNMT